MMWFRLKQWFKTYVQTQILSQGCKSFFIFIYIFNQRPVLQGENGGCCSLKTSCSRSYCHRASGFCRRRCCTELHIKVSTTPPPHAFWQTVHWAQAHRGPAGIRFTCGLYPTGDRNPPRLMSGNKAMLLSCCSCCPPGGTRLRKHLPEGLEFSRGRGAQAWSSWASSSKPSSLCCPHSELHQPAADGFTIALASSSGH